jgi:hypothetical protein
VAWEITRAALHCRVDLDSLDDLAFDPAWRTQERLWSDLRSLPAFRSGSASLPERCDPLAWHAALQAGFQSVHNAIVMTADIHMLKQRPRNNAAPIKLTLRPLRLEQSCRLYRRFGSDRFIEIFLPSPESWSGALRRDGGEDAVAE